MRSLISTVRAVRDTPVADYSALCINTIHRVAYHPQIAISPVLLTLSVSYFKHTLWRCGQMWPYVGMGTLGTRLHRDCNAMTDTAIISPRVPSTLPSRSVGRRWENMILRGREDPRNLGQSEWDQKMGIIECEFSLYDKRRWKRYDIYLLWGLPNIYSPSLCPPPLPLYLHTTAVAPGRHTWSSVFEMLLEIEIEWTLRCTCRSWLRELWDPLGDHAGANLQAISERVWRYTLRPWSSDFGDALGRRDWASVEIHSRAMIERDWRSTWRWSIWREARLQPRLYSLVNL